MTVSLRKPFRSETDYELIWLLVFGSAAAFACIWIRLGLFVPPCRFHAITGLPCLTCGGTRAVRSLLEGRIVNAIEWNPLALAAVLGLAAFLVYAFVVVVFRLPRLRVGALTRPAATFLRVALVVAIAANWIYLVYRFSAIPA
jgi:hypothetical protein